MAETKRYEYRVADLDATYDVTLTASRYVYDGSLAVVMTDYSEGYPQPYGNVTVCLTESQDCKADCAYVDTNNMPDIAGFLERNSLARPTGMTARSGFCTYPEYRFSPEIVGTMCTEEN